MVLPGSPGTPILEFLNLKRKRNSIFFGCPANHSRMLLHFFEQAIIIQNITRVTAGMTRMI